MKKTFNPTVSIIRVLAMLTITFGHIIAWAGIYDYQLTAIGVEIFFFISGYLYGKKKIANKYEWLLQRAQRVLLPFWILAFVLSVYLAFESGLMAGFVQFLEALLNLQGIPHISTLSVQIGTQHLAGLSHCWFLTPMFICYIMTALISGTRLERLVDKRPWVFLVGGVLLQIASAYVGLQLSYYLQFFTGYFYVRAEHRIKRTSWKGWLAVGIITVVVCIGRVIANMTIDGTMLYNAVIARLSFNILAVWLYMTMDQICGKFPELSNRVAQSALWKKLDQLSYYIFLTHFMFMKVPFAVENYIPGIPLQLVCMLVLSIVSAWLLMQATEWALKLLSNQPKKAPASKTSLANEVSNNEN